ncbi:Flp pilus assembly protein, pilin Flp [Roseovarius litoreus]|jgi:Flp pilus assembly pilin Flp|uniref:Flp pilus assembly protein, pilin Flp n=1 Tax=Roseovarius litoreus TaxID=1155722 RepID=A0A1M7B1T7_9RHOB|nr:hypothetical protein [Roseovarius litoreus]SHL48978.1 Flp pilus assembly protein, pilin Flp [Roseovarius litoreus]
MIKFFKKFRSEEDGAVTVDWVVLTASVVGLAVGGVVVIKDGVDGLAGNIGTELSSATVIGLGELGQDTQSTQETTTQ